MSDPLTTYIPCPSLTSVILQFVISMFFAPLMYIAYGSTLPLFAASFEKVNPDNTDPDAFSLK